MNLGAGEVTLTSSQGVKLNNLLDHKVSLSLQDGKLTMIIDELYPTSVPANAEGQQLNVDLGIWLGGVGELDVPYLSNAIPPFRGCISEVRFESHQFDILSKAFKQCHDTKESCSSEFEASDGEATSFSTPDSFISFPTWSGASDAPRLLEFLMKTTIEDALLVFHPGRDSDFIAVGVAKGFLRGMVDVGGGMRVVENNEVQLDDDQWHRVKVQVSKKSFVINVDSQSSSVRLDPSENLDLVGNLYVGGIQRKMKDVFRDTGALNIVEEEITSESFIGCLGEIKVNQKDRSLQDAVVTKDVHVKCEGEDYDYSYSTGDYVGVTTTSPPVHIRYLDMDLNMQHCYPTADAPELFQHVTRLLDVTPMFVFEGGETFLDLNNMKPTFDLRAAEMNESDIIFTLLDDPWYGLIDMNINTRRGQKFTLLDVANKKIKYMHDGNERHPDQIRLEVVAQSRGYLPECLKTPQTYVIPVEILPVNNVPQLNGQITIIENGRTTLSPSHINVDDSDPRCNDLVVKVASAPSSEASHFENSHQPGRSISQFTCRELKNGNIFFAHRGGPAAEVRLEVFTGQSLSYSATLNMSVTQPHMTIVTNTGLLLSQGGNSSIGVENLAVLTHPRTGDALYNVTQPLLFGELQMMTNDGMYEQVTSFHQSDLTQNRLRYVSTDSSDQEDVVVERIRFSTHLGQFSLQNNTFLVKIKPAQVKVSDMVALEITAGKDQIITSKELQAQAKGKTLNPQTVKYILVKPPTLGSLLLLDKELAEGDMFTQKDVMDGSVSYRVRVRRAVDSTDQFQFRVFAEDQFSPLYTFPVNILADAGAQFLTNERLVVLQGGEQVLNKNYLWLESPSSTDVVYRVLQGPKYGRLIRDSPPGQPRFEGAIRVFSNEDLQLDRLIYKHDGSKTTSDEFSFSALDQSSEDSDGKTLSDVFRISIQSKNEHAPVRVVDKVFNVVRQGQRLLTTGIIKFTDEDSGFNDSQIIYAREGILSGNIVSTSNPSQPVFRFTQADLRDKKILFIHHGADRERFSLQVSDGFHKTTALLDIQASEPYLRVLNNAIIVIDHGSTKTLNTSLLSADSNMDIRDDSKIEFEITSPPSEGRIIVSGIEALMFTQEDLEKGVVSYEHNYESLRSKDSFSFSVQAGGRSENGVFRIKIFKQGYFSEPEVINNNVIISFEGEHTVINQDQLKVEQADILPSEMVFRIKERPRLGHLVMMTNSSDSTASPVLEYIHTFTQEQIDDGAVIYLSASVQGSDVFTVDVTNGFTSVEDLRVSVNVVPRFIPCHISNFTVKEGFRRAINTDIVNITHPFYETANIDFFLEQPPRHGEIRYGDGDEISYFTWNEVKLGQVFYMHDSSETTEDTFTLFASAYEIERRSLPLTVSVAVTPVNDEPPQLRRNTGLEVLAGEEADITSDMLSTEDADTPAEELVYHVEALVNGMVALKEAPEESVLNFTQAHVDKGEVIFIHEGEESGSFRFTVTDGEHTSPLYRFVVTARPLTITLVTEEELVVFPGSRQSITSANLGAVTSEDGNEISYSLIRPPRLGRLILANDRNQYEEITRFSQSQLESGAVFYEHQLPDEPFWMVRDAMEFTLSSQPAPDVGHILPVTVSFNAAHSNISSRLWRNKGLEIVQGQKKTIDESILDASNLLASQPETKPGPDDVVFEIRRFPKHGRVTLAGQDLPRDAPFFKQEDVARGRVEYRHVDSGASFDSFSFRARLNDAQGVELEEVFNITIKRQSSKPPELVTTDMLLEVLQGSMTILTQKQLNTQDDDSPPDEVHFKVTKPPGNGQLVDSRTMNRVSEFTQEMVNLGLVGFFSDNSLAGSFVEFTVSDGEHQTEVHTLHIGVLARTLVLNKSPEIKVKQGDDETLVTEEMLKVTTGGPVEEDILYKITGVPKYAAVMVDRQPTSAFTQKQIREGRVSVRFVKSTSPRDSVAFVARSRAANVSSVLNITVQPLANIAKDPLLPRGALVRLDGKLLDATPLANKTRASPTFTVIQQPQGARFVKHGGPGAGQPVDAFTQKDLDEGRVAMEILSGASQPQGEVPRDDPQSFEQARFLLKAHGVPPAECVLSFLTGPYNASGVYPATLLKVPSPTDSEDLPHATAASPGRRPHPGAPTTAPSGSGPRGKPHVSRRSNIWSILIPILVILALLLLAAILAYYLIRKNKTGKHNVQTAASKPKNGEVAGTETFRKTDPANNIPMSNVNSKDSDPELLQHCRTTNPALKKNQYWV